MSDDERSQGLLSKYTVQRRDDTEGKHADCRYFVLDPQHDPLAVEALTLYSVKAEEAGYTELAADLDQWLWSLDHPPSGS
jgi:hypothetical protein